ncbi:LysR family transcriptional regulator [Paucibacter sp. APW11]|uniref:LysR family transcriptional regulator n=1 Tax=Roseateles aquae TaxID=3077235 RepID=A0ABU3PII3_9BURK|nr:LysR family transcriptional regulator [Paucibacter sp. APW11]MDT9002381.1 LysR family transcriptional regulator [Paucibacter sp. APW11]
MRALNLDQLRTLVAIADLGTFAAAAQALHLAAPTVSLHISELESRLGAALLLRSKRVVALTAAGAALLPRARQLLLDADEAVRQIGLHAKGLTGRVRLVASTGPLVHLLPPVLEQMAAEHPEVEIELRILGTHHARERLLAGTADVALVSLPLEESAELQVARWRSDPVMALLPPQWKAPRRITPAWLADKPLILNEPGSQIYRQTMAWFGAAGLHPRARIELNYTEAMKSLVATGYGAAVLPLDGDAEPHQLALHERIQLRPLDPPLHRELAIAHRRSKALAPSVRQLLAVLAEHRQKR